LALTLNKRINDFSLTSTTGYYDQYHRAGNPGAEDEFATIWDVESEVYRVVNEDLHLNTDFSGPINFMLGGYFEHSYRYWFNAPDILNIFNPAIGNYTTTITTTTTDGDTYSAFGQLRWKILPNLEFAGGARFERDTKTSSLENLSNNLNSFLGSTLYPQGEVLNVPYARDNVSPEATLTWKPVSSQTIYAAYKTGYKSGGISSAGLLDATATSSNLVLGPEEVKGFEVGYKADLLANTLRLGLTAYDYNYDGLQVTARDATLFSFIILNAAKARTSGVEGSFDWRATNSLSFNGNIGYNRARFLEFPNAPCYVGQTEDEGCVGGVQNLAGRPLNRAPNVTFKLGADYKAQIVQGWISDLSTSAAYSSSYQTGTDYASAEMQSAFWLINAAIHISPESEKYQLSLIGRNLTNTYYKVISFPQALGNPGQFEGYFNQPRAVALEFLCHF
jgi:outer membrane receptor protein involved in Fe transport